LRERPEDIALLSNHFVNLFNRTLMPATPVNSLSADALETLRSYDWPGNVRELSNVIEQVYATCVDGVITVAELPLFVTHRSGREPGGAAAEPAAVDRSSLKAAERDAILQALAVTRGNKSKAARLLKISRKSLYAKLTRHHLAAAAVQG
jgi:DNA-binding NtrC family response regulator